MTAAPPTLSCDEVRDAYERHFNFGLGRLFRAADCPVESHATGAFVYDTAGRSYLDFATSFGVFNLGHTNPAVWRAISNQAANLATATHGLRSEPEVALRALLAAVCPGTLNHASFSGSGSEATEVALRIVAACASPAKTKIVSTTKAYHGKTLGALGLIGQAHLRRPFEPLDNNTRFVAAGDAAQILAAIDHTTAAVFVEPVTAGNYLVVPPAGYLAAIREACDRVNALMVVDEVQTAFGRTGTLFGVDHDGVVPDIMTMSKALTGGYIPFAATVFTDAVWQCLRDNAAVDALDLINNDANYPIAFATAIAVIEETRRLALPDRAAVNGRLLLTGLRQLASRYPNLIVSTDGLGLMTGLILRNRAIEFAVYLKMLRQGVITGLSLNSQAATPVLRLYPPLTVEPGEIERVLACLDIAFGEVERLPMFFLRAVHHATRYAVSFPDQAARAARHLLG